MSIERAAFVVTTTGPAVSIPVDAELVAVSAALGTAGTTASTVDVKHNGSTVFAGQNASAGPFSVNANATTSSVVKAVSGLTLGTQVTNNITSGVDIIDPAVHAEVALATLTAGDTVSASVTLGTSAANPIVSLYFVKK